MPSDNSIANVPLSSGAHRSKAKESLLFPLPLWYFNSVEGSTPASGRLSYLLGMIKMKWSNGFHLGRKLVKLWRCLKRRRPFSYSRRLLPPEEDEEEIHQRLWTGGGGCGGHGRVKRRLLLYRGKKGGEVGGGRRDVPKGHLAVYVGVKDPEHRFLVPVIYMNHPFFRRLLKVAEEEYGFDHKGGITIPCGVADFEGVKRSIDEEDAGHRARKETAIHRFFLHPF